MFPVGGYPVMLLLAAVAGLVLAGVGALLSRRLGWLTAFALAAFAWSLVVLALVTLIPANGAPGIVPAEGRLEVCSTDIGGPAPDGFWIFSGGQRLLNTVAFVPSGALWVLTVAHWRRTWLTVPIGLLGLAAFSAAIEYTQLELARLDRACDLTDVIDNTTGAAVGVAIGVVLAAALTPLRRRLRAQTQTRRTGS